MKSRRFQKSYRANASKAHKALGEVLRSGVFANNKVFQEYPVNKILPSFQSGRHKFDWVILDLKVVVEVMGQQHSTPATFGGRSAEEAITAFHQTQYNDSIKEQAAIDAGFTYIAIPHTDFKKISEPYLLDLIKEYYNNEVPRQDNPVSVPNDNDYRSVQKERARQYRKEQYRRRKAWLKSRREQEVADDVSLNQRPSRSSSCTQDQETEDTEE